MSDSFQSYVFAELVDGRDGFDRVRNWLLDEKVIEETVAENGIGEKGYLPGARASSVLIEDNDHWRSLSENGVVFSVGQIIEASTAIFPSIPKLSPWSMMRLAHLAMEAAVCFSALIASETSICLIGISVARWL
jgi:hypothetical protein